MKYIFLLFPLLVVSQDMYKIDYFQTSENSRYYKGVLLTNGVESVYVENDTDSIPVVNNSNKAEDEFIITEVADDDVREVAISLPLSYEPTTYFNNSQDYFRFIGRKIYEKEKGEIIIKDTLPDIKWHVTDEAKEILGFQCKKAIGEYKCREYVVWFTTEIPLSAGPWHLNGLPGAILEAKSTDLFISFIAVNVKKVNVADEIEVKKNNFTKVSETITYDDYLKKLNDYSVELSKSFVTKVGQKKIEGGTITSISSTFSFKTYDLCGKYKGMNVKKNF